MVDRLTPPEYEPNVFRYVGEPEQYEKFIDIKLITGFEPIRTKKARLPRKPIDRRFIMIFHNDKQVSIPAFLCKRQGLV